MNKHEIFQLKITLVYTDPPIWRRFLVESNITFASLHWVIQDVMGWEFDHAWEFEMKKQRIQMPGRTNPLFGNPESEWADEVELRDKLVRVGQKFRYTYDFGDNWKHEILFEKRLPVEEGQYYPVCLEGEKACPPEDCGGIWGFYEKLRIIQSPPEDDEDDWAREWMGDFDPDAFDIDKVNKALRGGRSQGQYDEEVVENFLEFAGEPFTLEKLFEETGIDPTEEHAASVRTAIWGDDELVLDQDKAFPSNYVLKNASILIRPDTFEIEQGILIPGQRLFPFYYEDEYVEGFDLQYKYESLEVKGISLEEGDVDRYFGLMADEGIPLADLDDYPEEEGEGEAVRLMVWDLSPLYRTCQFKPGQAVLVKPLDIDTREFEVKYFSPQKLEKKRPRIEQAGTQFLEILREVLQRDIPFTSITHQLLYAYYEFGKKHGWDLPLPDLDTLLKQAPHVTAFTPETGPKLLRLTTGPYSKRCG